MVKNLENPSSAQISANENQMAGKSPRGFKSSIAAMSQKIGHRIFRLFGELIAISLGLAFIWAYGMSALLTQKRMDMSFLEANAKIWFSEAFNGKSTSIEKMEVSWHPEVSAIFVDAKNINIRDAENVSLQSISHVSLGLDYNDMISGKFTPVTAEITGGAVTWLRRDNGDVVAGLGTPSTVGVFGTFPAQEPELRPDDADRPSRLSYMRAVTIRNADVFIVDGTRGVDLHFMKTDVSLTRQDKTAHLRLDATLDTRAGSGLVTAEAQFSEDLEDFSLDLTMEKVNPKFVAPKTGLGARMRLFDLPLDVSLSLNAQRGTGLQSVNLEVHSGAGTGGLGPKPNHIKSLDIRADYDPENGRLNVNEFKLDGSRTAGDGTAFVTDIGRPAIGFFKMPIGYEIDFKNLNIDATHMFDDITRIKNLKISGTYDAVESRGAMDTFNLGFDGFSLNNSLTFMHRDDGSLSRLSGKTLLTGDMTSEDLLLMWPTHFVTGARRWIDKSIQGGLISDLKLEYDLPERSLKSGQFRNEDLMLTFNVRDGHVKYISTMTPLVNAAGRGVLRGNNFEFDVSSGQVGELTIQRGRVEMPRLYPYGGDMIIDVEGSGPVTSMLGLIDQKPFRFTSRYGLKAEDFSGSGQIALTIRRPLLEHFDQNRIKYSVEGDFEEVKVPFSLGSHHLHKGRFSLKADSAAMTVSGPVNLGPWRTHLDWKETFFDPSIPTSYRLAGEIDGNTLNGFGLGFREYFGGTAHAVIDAEGKGLSINKADLNIDLTKADIRAGTYWSKSPDVNGKVTAQLSRSEFGALYVEGLKVEAPGLEMSGRAAFAKDGRLEIFELTQALIESVADGQIKVEPNTDKTAFNIDISGKYLDISPIVSQTIRSNPGQTGLPMNLSATLERLMLDEMYVLNQAHLSFEHNGIGTRAARLTGDMPQGGFLVSLSPMKGKSARELNIKIPNADIAMQAFLNLKSLKGGQLELTAYLPDVGEEGPLTGTIIVDDFSLINAPVMAQVLSLASLKGLTDTLSGEGLAFSQFEAPFSYQDGAVSLRDARASGPALGLTGSGEIDFAGKSVDIDGVLVPAYTANSALSAIPVIGDIFVGKKGEGIFALSYSVKGPFAKTQVAANPLSALTPGFLRRIFDTQREDLPQNIPPEAIPPNPDGPR